MSTEVRNAFASNWAALDHTERYEWLLEILGLPTTSGGHFEEYLKAACASIVSEVVNRSGEVESFSGLVELATTVCEDEAVNKAARLFAASAVVEGLLRAQRLGLAEISDGTTKVCIDVNATSDLKHLHAFGSLVNYRRDILRQPRLIFCVSGP